MKGFIPCAAILAAGAAAVAQAPVDPVAAAREQVRRVVVYGAGRAGQVATLLAEHRRRDHRLRAPPGDGTLPHSRGTAR